MFSKQSSTSMGIYFKSFPFFFLWNFLKSPGGLFDVGRLPPLGSPFVLRTSVTSIADAKRRRAVRRAPTERWWIWDVHRWSFTARAAKSRFEQEGVLEQHAWTGPSKLNQIIKCSKSIQIHGDFPSFAGTHSSWQVEIHTLQAVVQILTRSLFRIWGSYAPVVARLLKDFTLVVNGWVSSRLLAKVTLVEMVLSCTVHDFSGRKTPMVFAPHLMAIDGLKPTQNAMPRHKATKRRGRSTCWSTKKPRKWTRCPGISGEHASAVTNPVLRGYLYVCCCWIVRKCRHVWKTLYSIYLDMLKQFKTTQKEVI